MLLMKQRFSFSKNEHRLNALFKKSSRRLSKTWSAHLLTGLSASFTLIHHSPHELVSPNASRNHSCGLIPPLAHLLFGLQMQEVLKPLPWTIVHPQTRPLLSELSHLHLESPLPIYTQIFFTHMYLPPDLSSESKNTVSSCLFDICSCPTPAQASGLR